MAGRQACPSPFYVQTAQLADFDAGFRPHSFEVSPWGTFLSASAQIISHPNPRIQCHPQDTHQQPPPLPETETFQVALGRDA